MELLAALLKRNGTPAPSFLPSTSKNDEPAIPDPAVFTTSALSASSLAPTAPPTVAQCAVHLELLQALSKLRHQVTKEAAFIEIFGTAGEEKEAWWAAFVEVAVGRFGTWWWGVEEEMMRREKAEGKRPVSAGSGVKTPSIRSGGGGGGGGGGQGVRELPKDMLPPLDVLMVWHSYMLNPRCYNEDALHFSLNLILNTAFPWAQIHAAIDNDTFDYNLPEPAAKFFEKLTLQSPNLVSDLLWKDSTPKKRIKCPTCRKEDVKARISDTEKKGGGWMDGEFAVECSGCGAAINKQDLCADKFRRDLEAFLWKGPEGRMRMTNLDRHGYSYPRDPTGTSWDAAGFVNTFFRAPATLSAIPPAPADPDAIKAGLTTALPPNTSPAHISAMDLTLSAYTSTPNPYSLDLTAAVIRQGGFVDKMNNQLWIRSPGLIGTSPLDSLTTILSTRGSDRGCVLVDSPSGFLSRAIERYAGFFALFKEYPGKTLVPTLDVDLAWHSAMLTPVTYRAWCRAEAGRFIDHDDRLDGGALEGGFEFTCEKYWERYGKVYGKCCCWFCEAAINEGLDPQDERSGAGLKKWKVRKEGRRERAVRVRVEFYREVEKRRRGKLGGLARAGLFEALKRV